MSDTPTIKLRNGHEHARALVITTHMTLSALLDTPPGVLFYEAVMLARNPAHKLFGNAGEKLAAFGLLDDAGHMHRSISEITQALSEGDGLDMQLLPIAEAIAA